MKIHSHIVNYIISYRLILILILSIIHPDLHACLQNGYMDITNNTGVRINIERYSSETVNQVSHIGNHAVSSINNGEKVQVCWLYKTNSRILPIKFLKFTTRGEKSKRSCRVHTKQNASGVYGHISCGKKTTGKDILTLTSDNCVGEVPSQKVCNATLIKKSRSVPK